MRDQIAIAWDEGKFPKHQQQETAAEAHKIRENSQKLIENLDFKCFIFWFAIEYNITFFPPIMTLKMKWNPIINNSI